VSDRYASMFARLRRRGQIAFVPFTMLGDPNPQSSLEVLKAMAEGGADALELGIPFSDPTADGPTIQAAARRSLTAGTTPADCLVMIRAMRSAFPDLPLGLLVYANLVVANGVERFYAEAAAAGLDSVLVADVPTLEATPFCEAARGARVDPILLLPPNASPACLDKIAGESRGYTYVVSRRGVTGADEEISLPDSKLLRELALRNAAPPLLGFGISRPEHVVAARKAGAAGVICGSAVVERVEAQLAGGTGAIVKCVRSFVAEMKAATSENR